MAKQSNRQSLIDTIMKTKYRDDDDKYYDSNLAFLESLSILELTAMADMESDEEDEFEDEFELKGEICDFDFDDNEL